jgi:6-pyruvoyl-tetrahydropterin synthase
MKKKKSILYFVIFSFIFVFFFFLTIFLLANRHWFYPYETVIEYKYDSDKDDRIDDLKDECEKLLVAQNDYDKFISDFNELKTIYTEIGTNYKIEYLNVCNNPLKGNIRLMNIYYEKKVELSKWFGSLYSKINESAYKNQFFNGVDEKEINYLIKSHSEEASKKYEVISNISEEFQNLDEDKQTSQFATYYTKFINANNEYAKVVGYDNYYNYANEK